MGCALQQLENNAAKFFLLFFNISYHMATFVKWKNEKCKILSPPTCQLHVLFSVWFSICVNLPVASCYIKMENTGNLSIKSVQALLDSEADISMQFESQAAVAPQVALSKENMGKGKRKGKEMLCVLRLWCLMQGQRRRLLGSWSSCRGIPT